MRRRRRRRFYWLPNLGIQGATGGGLVAQTEIMSHDFLTALVQTNGGVTTAITDVTFDDPRGANLADTAVTTPMAEFLRSGYMLRRVVGNLFVHPIVTSSPEGYSAAIVTFAMFVARADEATDNIAPIGSLTGPEQTQNYDPTHNDNVREPYLFRRTWILGTPFTTTGDGTNKFPTTNAGYGSAYEGTFVDQKTLRRVDGDNRLWAVLSARNYPVGAAHTSTVSIRAHFDFRYLGRPISTAKRGAF